MPPNKTPRKTRIPTRPETPSQPRPKAGRTRRPLFADDEQETPKKPPNKTKEKTKAKVITDAFYDPKTGLSLEPYKLYKKLKAAGHNVTIKEVENVLKNQLVNQVFRPMGEYKKNTPPSSPRATCTIFKLTYWICRRCQSSTRTINGS